MGRSKAASKNMRWDKAARQAEDTNTKDFTWYAFLKRNAGKRKKG
jgi:hypothetical protein